jgi:hypothetical protein
LALYTYRAVANGFRTDHPIPDLPFVDDSDIPLDDPEAIEAVGRHPGGDTWGRYDRNRRVGGWMAFTTDPSRHDLSWSVRWHPEHGRSVVLYRHRDAGGVHMAWWGPALLFRSGGYWWDGTTWYRPGQVWDAAGEEHFRRPVPAAATVTAADMLSTGDPARGQVQAITDVDPDAPLAAGRWLDDLALWAQRRGDQAPLTESVVTLTAPELNADQMIGATEVAAIAGIAASTLRAYLSRGESDLPLPQATLHGRSMWARPVAGEWAEERRRSPEGVAAAVSTQHAGGPLPSGIAEAWDRFTRSFFSRLWDRPDVRRRWALRWRNEDAVRGIAQDLAWEAAASLPRLVPTDALAMTVQIAVLEELRTGQKSYRVTSDSNKKLHVADPADNDDPVQYGIAQQVTQMLDWLIRHDPASAGRAINSIIGEAERELAMTRRVSERSVRVALALDSELDPDTQKQFLSRVLTSET